MISKKTKDILDLVVSICSIVSCIVAVFGVFQVVDFVIDVKPIVVPIAQEVKEGNMDVRQIFSGTATIRHDTVRVIQRDTIYLGQGEMRRTETENRRQQTVINNRLTEEDEQHLDKSSDNVSEQVRNDIEDAETKFRNSMREKIK